MCLEPPTHQHRKVKLPLRADTFSCGGGGTESRVADELLHVFAIHCALSTPARYREAIYLRLFASHAKHADALLYSHTKAKTALRAVRNCVEVGEIESPSESSFESESTTRSLFSNVDREYE